MSSFNTEDWTVREDGWEHRTVDPHRNSSALLFWADETSGDGRSPWFWLRNPEGDLMLACFPQGDTYFDAEPDFGRP